jgi:ABC-type multidrug transport system fused ATPase/permease subunit
MSRAPAHGLRTWWAGVTFGTPRAGRRILSLAILGAISGAGEALVVLLLVALVSRDGASRLPVLVPGGSTWTLAALALGSVAVLAATHLGAAWIAARTAAEGQRMVQLMLLDAFLRASWTAQRASPPGELQELVTGKARLAVQGSADAARAVSTAANLLIVVAVAILVDVRATLGLIVVVAFAVAISRPFQARTRRIAVRTAAAASELAAKVAETARVAGDLRIFGVGGRAREDLAADVDASARLAQQIQLSVAAVPPLTRDATLAVLVVAMAVIVSAADVSLTVLGATVVLVLRALAHAQMLATTVQRFADRWANLEPIMRRLADWGPGVRAGGRRCPRIGTVQLREVSVGYAPDAPDALAAASLVVADGEQLGVIGPTGAGKSTLAAVLLGLLEPREGQVLVDGAPLAELDPDDWHARIAWVAQDPLLLTGTVRENIRFLRPDVDDAEVARAAQAAVLGTDLAGWREGLDHDVGPAGTALSGGQRQRVALARALAGSPDLVVLDEPTSALDAHTEAAVRDTLAALREHATVVVIAHRLSTVNACDRVAVMRGGRIVALGPPRELAQSDPYFREALVLSAAAP